MLQNNPFYWGTIRKVVVAFGSLFSDIHIQRIDSGGTVEKTIKVPLTYGPKEKWIVRQKQNPMPGTDDQVELVLPRMSYEITGFTYDYERHLPSTGVTVKALTNTNQMLKSQFNPVPYNLGFNLSIMTKTIEDGLMIVEQILPFFAPDYTVTILDMPELDLKKDIPIVFNGITPEDNYDGTFQERRTIIFTLNFTAKAYLYPPVKLQKINIETDINFIAEPGTVPNNNIKVLVSPSSATLTAGSQRQLLLSLINTTGVTWTLNPNVGTVSASGVYTAPSVIVSASQVTVRATSVVDPTQFSESVITLTP